MIGRPSKWTDEDGEGLALLGTTLRLPQWHWKKLRAIQAKHGFKGLSGPLALLIELSDEVEDPPGRPKLRT